MARKVGEEDRVAAAEGVADREERRRRLSEILRDKGAAGSEVVAASKALEAMESADSQSSAVGLPAPTSRPDQVARLVRILDAAGYQMVDEALEIICTRIEKLRENMNLKRAAGLMVDPPQLRRFRETVKTKSKEERNAHRTRRRSEQESGGADAAESGSVPELRLAEDAPEPDADAHESDGSGDRELGEETPGSERGGGTED